MESIPKVLNLSESDARKKNYRLAFKLFLEEVDSLNIPEVKKLFERWKIRKIEGDNNSPRITIDFPEDVSRIQFFINSDGEEYVRYIEGKKNA